MIDNYDVFDGDRHIGRIMLTPALVLDDHGAGASAADRAGLCGDALYVLDHQ